MYYRTTLISFLALGGAANAAITAITPNSVSASSFFANSPTFGPENTYDGNTASLTVGTQSGFAAEWATQGSAAHTLVFDFGEELLFSDLFYAQRINGNDRVDGLNIWYLTNDPGPATLALPSTLGSPDSITPLTVSDLNLQQSTVSGTGRYVVVQIIPNGGGNPGARELRFNGTAVPEPSSIALLGLAGLGLLRRRR